jgi:2-(1,2-epoxy-1,2-dihydrophenyl)acetyl-CoA isomerase
MTQLSTRAEVPVRVRHSVADGVARIVLDRPEASNALDLAAAVGLHDAVDAARDDAVRCVVVAGSGPRFCVGGDLDSFVGSDDVAARLYDTALLTEGALRELGELPKPVVVGVHGAVAGAGLSFVLNADLAIAARSTRFVMAYAAVGLTPDCGVSYLLPRVIGQRRAMQMALLGSVLTADQALDWGLVSEVVADSQLETRLEKLGRELAAGPTHAFAETKRLIRAAEFTDRTDNALDEARTISSALMTEAAQTRVAAFLARRSR